MIGKVKSYNTKKGFGFIVHDGRDIFFHVKNVEQRENLEAEQMVSFDIGVNARNGLQEALNVCKN
jgi:cold shock CspA family protein